MILLSLKFRLNKENTESKTIDQLVKRSLKVFERAWQSSTQGDCPANHVFPQSSAFQSPPGCANFSKNQLSTSRSECGRSALFRSSTQSRLF